jgi:hypothetical protein
MAVKDAEAASAGVRDGEVKGAVAVEVGGIQTLRLDVKPAAERLAIQPFFRGQQDDELRVRRDQSQVDDAIPVEVDANHVGGSDCRRNVELAVEYFP